MSMVSLANFCGAGVAVALLDAKTSSVLASRSLGFGDTAVFAVPAGVASVILTARGVQTEAIPTAVPSTWVLGRLPNSSSCGFTQLKTPSESLLIYNQGHRSARLHVGSLVVVLDAGSIYTAAVPVGGFVAVRTPDRLVLSGPGSLIVDGDDAQTLEPHLRLLSPCGGPVTVDAGPRKITVDFPAGHVVLLAGLPSKTLVTIRTPAGPAYTAIP